MAEKRTRRTRAELRDIMMAAGKQVLFQIEPTLGFEQLTYSTVFEHLREHHDQKVTIGSVHERIWKNQRDFQLDVVAAALSDPLPLVPDTAFTRAAEVISELDLSGPEQRRYATQSAIRLSSFQLNPVVQPEATDLAYIVRFRLWALGAGHPEAVGFLDAMNQIRTQSTLAYTGVVRGLMDLIGLRVRVEAGDPDDAIETIAVLGNATMIGLRTDVLDAAHRPRKLPTGPSGELEEWHNDAFALWSIVRNMLELDGDDLAEHDRRL